MVRRRAVLGRLIIILGAIAEEVLVLLTPLESDLDCGKFNQSFISLDSNSVL